MTNSTILILGGTGKTGRRIAARLRAADIPVRTAARTGANVHFDWDEPSTHDAALDGVGATYLVPPALRTDHAEQVAGFVDRAEAAGVRHVTFLSARGVELAPPEVSLRAIELDVASRTRLTHTILRPGWFMQNFSEDFLRPAIRDHGVIPAPTGDGAVAFVHADDIAEVAAATLRDGQSHAGAGYTLTGPEALTFAEVAARISAVAGRRIAHLDVPAAEWISQTVAAGVPEAYAQMLGNIMGGVREGSEAATTDAVLRVTGHAPRTFESYLSDDETVARWTPSKTTAST
jgi:uncharacterized protein YbjT (DUF2867 family)